MVQDGEKESQADSLEDLDFNLKKKKRKKRKVSELVLFHVEGSARCGCTAF